MDAFVPAKFRSSLSSNTNFSDLSRPSSSSSSNNADPTSFSLGKYSVTKDAGSSQEAPAPGATLAPSKSVPPAPLAANAAPTRNGVISFSLVGGPPPSSAPSSSSAWVEPVASATTDSSTDRLENTAPAKRIRRAGPDQAPAQTPVSLSLPVVSTTPNPPQAAAPPPAPAPAPAVVSAPVSAIPPSGFVSGPPSVITAGPSPANQSGYRQIGTPTPSPPQQQQGPRTPYWWTPELEHFVVNWRPSVIQPFGNYKVAPLFPPPPPPPLTYPNWMLLVLEIAARQDDAFQRHLLELLFEHGYLSREDALRVYYG